MKTKQEFYNKYNESLATAKENVVLEFNLRMVRDAVSLSYSRNAVNPDNLSVKLQCQWMDLLNTAMELICADLPDDKPVDVCHVSALDE